jgi:hypothetical protein
LKTHLQISKEKDLGEEASIKLLPPSKNLFLIEKLRIIQKLKIYYYSLSFFETQSSYVTQACLKLANPNLQAAGITDVPCHIILNLQ